MKVHGVWSKDNFFWLISIVFCCILKTVCLFVLIWVLVLVSKLLFLFRRTYKHVFGLHINLDIRRKGNKIEMKCILNIWLWDYLSGLRLFCISMWFLFKTFWINITVWLLFREANSFGFDVLLFFYIIIIMYCKITVIDSNMYHFA